MFYSKHLVNPTDIIELITGCKKKLKKKEKTEAQQGTTVLRHSNNLAPRPRVSNAVRPSRQDRHLTGVPAFGTSLSDFCLRKNCSCA